MEQLIRSKVKTIVNKGLGEGEIEVIVNSGQLDRHNEIIDIKGIDLSEYKESPVVAWGHNYDEPAIGKATKIWKTKDGMLKAVVKFATDIYPFANLVYNLIKDGYMNAFSIGFMPTDGEENEDGTYIYLKSKMLEFSAVLIGADPKALATAKSKGLNTDILEEIGKGKLHIEKYGIKSDKVEAEVKSVIPFKSYPLADEVTAWDGPAEIKDATPEQLKAICAWYDSENPDIKGSYKLPHHQASGYKTVWKGVAAAMAALLGARGGANIPDGDKQGVYNHLSKHYKEFEKEVPEFKEYEATIDDKTLQLIKSSGDKMKEARDALDAVIDTFDGKEEETERNDLLEISKKALKSYENINKDKSGRDKNQILKSKRVLQILDRTTEQLIKDLKVKLDKEN